MIRLVILAVAIALGHATCASAQTYPDRLIKLITPFPAGGPVDVMARFVAQQLSARIGQVIVDNRSGAGGTIGAKAAAERVPDGYTLLLGGPTTLAGAPALYKGIGYDPIKSFDPIALVSSVPFALVVAPSLPIHSVAELVAYAKAHPAKLNYGAPTGALPHLTAEMFKMFAGVDIVHIPYKGAANAITDILSGQIDVAFEPTSVLLAHIADGKVRALATTGKTRSAQLPELPTMIESGYPDFVSLSWSGVVAPAGTPGEIIAKLNAAINDSLAAPETKEALAKLGADPRGGSPQDFTALIAEETPRWAAVVKAAGVRID